MPFEKGNTFGIKGRTPSIKTQRKRFIEKHPDAYEELMEALYARGMGSRETKCPHCKKVFQDIRGGDSEDARYIIDRIKGKPKATLGIAEEDKELLTVATVLEFRKMVDRKQLEEGYIEGQYSEGKDEAVP